MKFRFRHIAIGLSLFIPLLLGLTQSTIAGTAHAAGTPGVRWGFYVTYNPNSWTSLQANAQYLNYISPWFYNVSASGAITGRDQTQASALIKQVGARSLPMLKNSPTYNDFTAILSDPGKQTDIINSIDTLIATYDYDGITIDFEGLNASDRELLTGFMSDLYSRLHPEGKLVAMAVPPKIRDITSGWAAAYDYDALGLATNYLLIMAYDYHWANSDPGPIAPMDKLQATADYTLARVPASKVIWGVGVYGYDWAKTDSGGTAGKAEYRTFSEADALAASPGVDSGYDQDAESPWVRYTRDGQQREIWYENRRSFEAKLGLIESRGMAGFGIWRLGQEDPGIWDAISGAPTPRATSTPPRPAPTQRPKPTATSTPTPRPLACQPVKSPPSGKTFFPQTGHTLGGAFLGYWQKHGALPVYGYPLTEEFTEASPTDGKRYTVQYFERNRFEYHPENAPPNDVQLGLLGVQAVGKRIFPPAGDPFTGPDVVFFPQVKHTLGGAFLGYWQAHGGLAQFGYPISEPVMERSPTDGHTYMVQYTERARLELHPEYAGTDAEVLLGLLGLDAAPCQ